MKHMFFEPRINDSDVEDTNDAWYFWDDLSSDKVRRYR